MDFGDILGIFLFIAVPIIIKSFKDKKDITEKKPAPQGGVSTGSGGFNGSSLGTQEIYDSTELYKQDSQLFMTQKEREEEYQEASREGYSMEWEEKDFKETAPKRNKKKRALKRVKNEIGDVISTNEIGSKDLEYNFDEKDLVQGIIMSEILSKPKALRNK